MATTVDAQQKVILSNVSWETYLRLSNEHSSSGTHFIYNGEDLEIMVLSSRHEQPRSDLDYMVLVLCEEFELDVVRAGSMTYRREDLRMGFEPDSAYYFAHAGELEGRYINPATDPPPDLIIEVDVTSPSLPRFPIYAAFGVPEIWRYAGKRVTMYRLEAGRYEEMQSSIAIPALTAEVATRFMEQRPRIGDREWVRGIREWARGKRRRA